MAKLHLLAAWAAHVFLMYTSLSVKDLRKHALGVHAHLESESLTNARQSLAKIVGRDTEQLDQEGVARACVETVAESTVDGIVSPLFYAALGGGPLALAYKTVNTLDSMIGYKNERYRDFGFGAAKLDELLNWIPAQLSYLSIVLATLFPSRGTGHSSRSMTCPPRPVPFFRTREAISTGWRDGVWAGNGVGAIAEATFAGALGLRLGGPDVYEGQLVRKPFLGVAVRSVTNEAILDSLRLTTGTAWISLCFALLLSL